MAIIKLDPDMFETAAVAIDTCVKSMKQNMTAANAEVATMRWNGQDSLTFNRKWASISGYDSTYWNMVKALESYAKYLRYAGKQYAAVQKNAQNLAKGLLK